MKDERWKDESFFQTVLTSAIASTPASEKRNIPCTKGAGVKQASEKRNILFHKSLILLSYMVISCKAAKPHQIYIHAKAEKVHISR